MQTCTACGAQLPPDARFCGNCGHVQEATSYTDAETRRSETPPPSSWSYYDSTIPATSGTPPPPGRDEREERKDIPPWLPLYGAGAGLEGGQAFPPSAPSVAGTPQISGVPSVGGTPSIPPAPPAGSYQAGQAFAQGGAPPAPSQAPYYPGVQGGHTSYPAANQAPAHMYPQQPTQWGTQEPHPLHGHEHHIQHAAPAHAVATKAAGGIALKSILIAVAAVVVIAGGGVGLAAYLANRTPPLQPVISITSNYKVGNALAGASGTVLHISGSKFSNNSTITFLLDGASAPGSTGVKSDANGSFQADLKITDGWSVGTHTLTAKDADNNSTQHSVTVMVVSPGQANTPGPLGAPPDDASFHVNANITAQFGSSAPFTETQTVIVTGHPDPTGGSVCESTDNGQPNMYTSSTFDTSTAYQETAVYSCTGTYKAGKFTYTQMFVSDVIKYYLATPVVTCTLTSPQPNMELSGSYTGNNTFSGTITYPAISQSVYSCDANGANFFHRSGQGTWTGSVTTS